ncbi:MAG: hypothetical protein P1P85_03590 [Patescibacteria group bacterium]|nr:hypothetical protein [Patescibacteria group bacterium]
MSEKREKLSKVFIRRSVIFFKLLLSGTKIFFSNSFWKDRLIVNLVGLSILLNLSLWIYFIQNTKESIYPIILHYNLIFGVDYLGDYEKIYLISFTGLVLILFNSVLGYILYKKEKLASYFLVSGNLLVQFFLIMSGYLIIQINS